MTAGDPLDPPPLASPARRLGGFLIDLVVLTALALLSLPAVSLVSSGASPAEATSTLTTVNVVLVGLYQVGFVATSGQTPGKVLVRTRVLDAAALVVPSLTAALARYALPMAVSFVPVAGIPLVMLVYAWLTWDRHRQGLHDKLASTLVVDAGWARPIEEDGDG